MLPFLLHAANRNIKTHDGEYLFAFYEIKDKILKKHGIVLGYDIQHIKGKQCWSCGGTGQHAKYGYNGKIYDYDDCYHCMRGWYKLPMWICLHRISYGKYIFHKPLKKEQHFGNPFTEESMGFKVTERPVIEGYIEHGFHKFGDTAVLILFFIYNRAMFKKLFDLRFHWKKVRTRNKIHNFFRWQNFIFWKPNLKHTSYDYDGEELPF